MVLDQGLVRAGNSLILDISMVLLVLIHKVVHNLDPAVWQLHSVLAFHIVSIPLLSSGVNIGVAIFIIAMHIIAKLVVLGSFLMVGSRGWVVGWSWGMVDSMVHWVGSHWGSMVGHWVDNWGSMMGHRVNNWGSMVGHRVDNWGSMMGHRVNNWGRMVGHRVDNWGS